MLQQTQVKTVIPYWERWMERLPDVRSLARARGQTIHKLWEGLGYYTRVRNAQKAARLIVKEHGGRFPTDFQQILSLPGIGRYTAGAISSIAFNQPTAILDGNAARVLARIFALKGDPRVPKTNASLWQISEKLVRAAAQQSGSFNQALMELGALVCTPRQPQCQTCPVAAHCVAHRRGVPEKYPQRKQRPQPTRRRFMAFVVITRGKLLIRRRPDGVVNGHLWEFPNIEVLKGDGDPVKNAMCLFDRKPISLARLCDIQHSITRYRISLEGYSVRFPTRMRMGNWPGEWYGLKDVQRLPFSSAHKQILTRVQENFSKSD